MNLILLLSQILQMIFFHGYQSQEYIITKIQRGIGDEVQLDAQTPSRGGVKRSRVQMQGGCGRPGRVYDHPGLVFLFDPFR